MEVIACDLARDPAGRQRQAQALIEEEREAAVLVPSLYRRLPDDEIGFYLAARNILQDTIAALEGRGPGEGPAFFLAYRDAEGRRLASLCVHRRVGDAQFHISVGRSPVTSWLYKEKGWAWPRAASGASLAVDLHRRALALTGARRAYAPPFPAMLALLKAAFSWRLVDSYEAEGFDAGQRAEIARSWPRDACNTLYCFWEGVGGRG